MDNIYLGPYKIIKDLGPNVQIQLDKNIDIIHKSRVKKFIAKMQDE